MILPLLAFAFIASTSPDTKTVSPAPDGSLTLVVKSADIQGPAKWIDQPAPPAGAGADASADYLNLQQGTKIRWTANMSPGVYNVVLRYEAPDATPKVRLQVDDGRKLTLIPFKSSFPPDPKDSGSGWESMGPLEITKQTQITLEMSLDAAEAPGTFAVAKLLMHPINGTLPSVLKTATEPDLSKIQTRVNPKDGAEMILIPEGEFTFGGLDVTPCKVTLQNYWIYKFPVTVKEYKQYCKEIGQPMPDPVSAEGWIDDHPMENVSWFDSMAYAKWAGVRLPTEAEWEKAARGVDGRVEPWGNDFDTTKCQTVQDLHGFAGTCPVGYFPGNVSPYGVRDMLGNVWQWCSSRMGPVPYRSDDGREDLTFVPGQSRVYRGGGAVLNSWRLDWTLLHRGNFAPKIRDASGKEIFIKGPSMGFRCAASS